MALIDCYAFGISHGYSSVQGNKEHEKYLETFYSNVALESGRKMVVSKRPDGSVFYTLLVYADKGKNFCDYNGRSGSFFGLSLVLTNQQFKDPGKIWTLLNNVYNNSIKGNIIDDEPLRKKFKVPNLRRPEIKKFIEDSLQNEFNKGDWSQEFINFQYNKTDPTNYQVFPPTLQRSDKQNSGR